MLRAGAWRCLLGVRFGERLLDGFVRATPKRTGKAVREGESATAESVYGIHGFEMP
jgi:hypothetical protein